MSIAILAENVSAIPRAILALKSIGNTVGDTLKVSAIPAIAILLLRY